MAFAINFGHSFVMEQLGLRHGGFTSYGLYWLLCGGGIFLNRDENQCPLHCKDQSPDYQGKPNAIFLMSRDLNVGQFNLSILNTDSLSYPESQRYSAC